MTDEVPEPEYRCDVSVQLVDHMGNDMSIVRAARVSTLGIDSYQDNAIGEFLMTSPSDEKLIGFLLKNRHGTPFEHNCMTFLVEAPIVVFREWQRHRVQSYNEESGRYKELRPIFYVPPDDRPLLQVGKPGAYTFEMGSDDQYEFVKAAFGYATGTCWTLYQGMLNSGIAKEVARMVLPLNIFSSMYVTMNLRAAFSFLSLRVQDEGSTFKSFPMFEIDRAAQQLEEHVADLFPYAYGAFVKNGRVSP